MTVDALERGIDAADAVALTALFGDPARPVLEVGDVDLLRRAADVVGPDGGPLPVAVAWRLGYALHQAGHFAQALDTYRRAGADERRTASTVDRAFLAASEASSYWATGEQEASREAADRAVAAARTSKDDAALSASWVAQALVFALEGDRHANRAAYEKALEPARRCDDVLALVRIHNNLGSLETEEGCYAEALVHLDQALALAEPRVPDAVRALTHINRAEALLGLGRVMESLAEQHLARDLARASESPMLGLAVVGIADGYRVCGNATQAAISYREAIGIAERSGDAQNLVSALSGLARALVVDDVDEARGLVKRALDQPAALGQVPAMLAAGWVGLAVHSDGGADGTEVANQFARMAVREAGRRHDLPGLAEGLELQALVEWRDGGAAASDLLAEACSIWERISGAVGLATNQALRARFVGDVVTEQAARRRLRALGVRDDASRIAGPLQVLGQVARAQVSIRALGSFSVLCDGEPVPASAWQSRKSRDALKILVGRRGRPITRDALAEHLWPDSGGGGNRLSVVLSTLRNVLDPGKQHGSDHYVVADRESVRLDLEHVELDVVGFTQAARAALRTVRAGGVDAVEELERAAAMYTGHYLDDDPYSDWSVALRDELLGTVLEVRRQLAALLVTEDDGQRAVPWLVGLIGDDPYDEPAHHDLVRTLHRCRRHGEARRAYRAYATRMAEIGTPVTPAEQLLRD